MKTWLSLSIPGVSMVCIGHGLYSSLQSTNKFLSYFLDKPDFLYYTTAMGEGTPRNELPRRRIADERFIPASVAELREELGKAGMLTKREYATGKKILLYPDELLARLVDEAAKGLRTFYRVRYDGQRRTVIESGMNTFRGKIYHMAPSGEQYLVQCAGNVPVDHMDALGRIDPSHLPPGFILKRDSSTSGKLLVDGSEDPLAALYAETSRQLGVQSADFCMRGEPKPEYEEKHSFLFPKLLTRFTNVTYFLEMLANGYKDQYVQKGKPKLVEGEERIPVTVSTWIPAKLK